MKIVHLLITLFIVCGSCLASWPVMLQVHIIFNSLVIAQWLLNGGRCILSSEYDDDSGYTADVLSRVTGVSVTNEQANVVSYVLTIGAAIVSSIVLLHSYT